MIRIFQIGVSRCGTTSIHEFIQGLGVPSIHWDHGRLGARMMHRISLGENPIADYPSDVVGFTDFCPATRRFDSIYRYYPDALYILNVRPIKNWVRSMLSHGGDLLQCDMARYHLGALDMVRLWRAQFLAHNAEVRAFFHGKPNFLEFDIEDDPPDKLKAFVGSVYPQAWNASFGKHNSTKGKA